MPEKLDKKPLNFRLPLATLKEVDAAPKHLGLKCEVFLSRLLENAAISGARFPDLDTFIQAIKSMEPARPPD